MLTARQAAMAALGAGGLLAGWALQPVWGRGPPAWPWYAYPGLVAALAVGVPMALGTVGTSGAYATMARLWAAIGALAILLTSAGAAATVHALVHAGSGQPGWLLIAAGTGLLAGLGIVKAALRRARTQGPG